jgi:hypothetical protein
MNPTTNVIVSKLFNLTSRDWLRGLVVAVISAVLSSIYSFTQAKEGIHGINWDFVLNVAVNNALSYIILNLGTGPQILVNNPTKQAVAAVKAGAPIEVAGTTIAQKTAPTPAAD